MIKINNITKVIKNRTIIDGVSFVIPDGTVTALVGANGSGKTTLIRIISGLLKPDAGQIEFSPKNKGIGVLLGSDVKLYDKLTGYENLCYFASLHNIEKNSIDSRIQALGRDLDYLEFMHRRTCDYSKGMRQKIGFAISIIHDPQIILLDEPTTGLDLPTIMEVFQFVKYCKSLGKTILIATHNLVEIENLSDNIIAISKGKVIESTSTQSFFQYCSQDKKIDKLVNIINLR